MEKLKKSRSNKFKRKTVKRWCDKDFEKGKVILPTILQFLQ